MLIRKYKSEDRAACLAIFESNLPQYFDPNERADLETWLNGQDESVLAYKNTTAEQYYVLESDNSIVACGGYYLAKAASRANLCWGMVDGAFHKRGFGRQLLEFRIQEIANKYPNFSISMDTSQHTIPFFEKLGFVVVKFTPNGYGAGLDRYDLVRPDELAPKL